MLAERPRSAINFLPWREGFVSSRSKQFATVLGAVDEETNTPVNLARWQILTEIYSDMLEKNPHKDINQISTNYSTTMKGFYARVVTLGRLEAFKVFPELLPMFNLVSALVSSQEDDWTALVKKTLRITPVPEFENAIKEAKVDNPYFGRKNERRHQKRKKKTKEKIIDPEWDEKVKNSYFGIEGEILLLKGWMEIGQIDREGAFIGMKGAEKEDVAELRRLFEKPGINLDKLDKRKAAVLEKVEVKLKKAIVEGEDLLSLTVCSEVFRNKVLESFDRFSGRKSLQYGLFGRMKSHVMRNSIKIVAPCFSA